MSKLFKISLLSSLIPVFISIVGYFIVPHQVITQFNHITYGNKLWIFLIPTILLIFDGICSFFVIKDRKKQGFKSPIIATALENRITISIFVLVIVLSLTIIYQIRYGR